MSDEMNAEVMGELEEATVSSELAKIDQTEAVVRLIEAGQIDCFDTSQCVAIPIAEDITPSLAKGLAVGGAAAELFANWGKNNLAMVLNGSIDDLRAANDGFGLIPRFLDEKNRVTAFARLQKVPLDPAQVASAMFQVAAAYVQAQYMEEIDERLKSIQNTLSEIKGMLDDQRIAKVESSYNQLSSFYIPKLNEYLEDDTKLIPARTQILAIIKELNDSWTEQVHATGRLCQTVLSESKPDEKKIEELTKQLVGDDRIAAAIFGTLCVADQARLLYNQELSSDQIALVQSQERGQLENYLMLRSTIVKRLDADIDKIRRAPLAFPGPLDEPDRDDPRGVFEMVGRAIDGFARRATSDTPWNAAKKQTMEYHNKLKGQFPHDMDVPCCVIAEGNWHNLDLVDMALNKADAIAVFDDKLYFIYEGNDSEQEAPVEDADNREQTA